MLSWVSCRFLCVGIALGALALAEPLEAHAQTEPAPTTAAAATNTASSSSSSSSAPSNAPLGYGAMPGGQRVAAAQGLPTGQVGGMLVLGLGTHTGLLGPKHRYRRGLANLAVAYAPLPSLSVGVAFDGRYDRHDGHDGMTSATSEVEEGYVGEPRLIARLARRMGSMSLGLQASIWFPGADAPSVEFAATTVELRALAALHAGSLVFTLNLGGRLDRSAESVDDPKSLTPQDQVSLGVSAYDALTLGAMASAPLGPVTLNLELGTDVFIGEDAPEPTARALLSAAVAVGAQSSLLGFAQLAAMPSPRAQLERTGTVPLIPYVPAFMIGVGYARRFGGDGSAKGYTTSSNRRAKVIAAPPQSEVAGVVVDSAGAPVAGAKVTVETERKTGRAVTDEQGRYRVGELPVGPARISIEVDGKQATQLTLQLVDGANAAPRAELEAELPPGELRGSVRARVGGKAIVGAAIVVSPGDYQVSSGADGTFAIEIPPGTYTLTTSADGYASQAIEAVIDQEGVTVKFINLDKK